MDVKVTKDWQTLAAVAERVGFGLLCSENGRLFPANGPMAAWTAKFDPQKFALEGDAALRLRNRAGRQIRFLVWALEGAWLVQEMPSGVSIHRFAPLPLARFHPLLRLDGNGRVVDANTPAGELLDYFACKDLLETALDKGDRSGERHLELQVNGRVYSFAIHPEGEGFLLFGHEVTERRHAEAALRQSEARLRALLEAAPDAIVTVDPEGTIEYVNAQGERMFGYQSGLLHGDHIARLLPGWYSAPVVMTLLAEDQTLRTGMESDSPLEGVRSDGSRFPVELSASPLDREGRVYVTSIIRDVTEREAAAQEIGELNIHLQRHVEQLTSLNAELEAFSYSVSHDLRGPLRAIDGFSSVLLEEYGERLDEEGRHILARVRNATARMADLIEGLLRLAQISRSELKREQVDLSAIAHFVADGLQRAEPQRQVEFRIQKEILAEGDRTLLTVVLENLLGNAWKFTAKCPDARIDFGADPSDEGITYYVRDNGAGFDMAYARQLFTPFARLHEAKEYPGNGIGLATVERVVRRHGGTIRAEAQPGRGAAFFFTLYPC